MASMLIKAAGAVVALFIVVTAIMALLNMCPPSGPWPMPPWCSPSSGVILQQATQQATNTTANAPTLQSLSDVDKSYGFNYLSKEDIDDFFSKPAFFITWTNDRSVLTRLGDVDVLWRVEWFKHGKLSDIGERMAFYHKNGIHYVGAQLVSSSQNDREGPILDKSMATISLDGEPIEYVKPGMAAFSKQYWMNILSPKWQSLLFNMSKQLIDAGVEGIVFDEPQFNAGVIDHGGTFDNYSMEGFREYLAERFSSSELSTYFNISDVGSFNFADYIKNNNLEDKWNKKPYIPITREFYKFEINAGASVMEELARSIKDYGKRAGHYILFYENAGVDYSSLTQRNREADALVNEMFYFMGDGPSQKISTIAKLAEPMFKHYIFLAEVSNDKGEVPKQTKNLFKYIFADAYSSKASIITDGDGFMSMHNWNYDKERISYDVDEASKYIRFAQNNSKLFSLHEPADVAVVSSYPSRMLYENLLLPTSGYRWEGGNLKGTIEALVDNEVPFHVLQSGDGYMFNDKLTEEALSNYSLVILPSVIAISEEELSNLHSYIEKGGKAIVIGNFAMYDERGTPLTSNPFSSIKEGENSIGKGTLYLVSSPIMQNYHYNTATWKIRGPREKSEELASPLMKIVNRYYESPISSDAPNTVNIRRYVDGNNIVLHIVNYDFDQVRDSFKPSKQFTITTEGAFSKATLYQFDGATIKQLSTSINGNATTVTIPPLLAYDIVVLEP
ncbi:MAG: hypothetical protein D6769_01190 [Methanobacteriota archaeon]|nr:MAG: hypothetical protein D6769_01190 [Euryarchaeota archaeon]